MTIEVLARPETENLVTLGLVKEELCIDGAAEDARLNNLIARASALFTRATGRTWIAQTVRERVEDRLDLRMMLTKTPLLTVSSVTYADEAIDSEDYSLENRSAGFLFREAAWLGAGLPYLQFASQAPFPRRGEELWAFTYRGGFYSPAASKLSGTIIGATQADPVVIESTAHARVDGDRVYISSAGGMTEINGGEYSVTAVDDDHFSLDDVDGTGYGAFTTGGTWVATPVLPLDVQDLVVEVVRYFYARRQRKSGISSETISGDYSVAYQLDGGDSAGPNGLPRDLEAQLAGYVRIA